MKALILNTGSELKKLLMKKKYLVLTVLGAIICILRIGGNVLVSKITGCLLYTSPSPRDRSLSRMPSSA